MAATTDESRIPYDSDTQSQSIRPLKPGIFAPVPSFFIRETEDLDLPVFEAHVVRVARAGAIPLVAGSMGEAIHLSHPERITLIKAARKALDGAGLHDTPVIAGTGAGSTRETIELCEEAAEAGADYAIVIASGFYAGALASNRTALKAFWTEVSNRSLIPVLIYNYPGATGGIDLDSDLIVELAKECPNICGVKLTCGNVGKLTRIADVIAEKSFASCYPRKNPNAPFLVLGGFADFITPSTFSNGHGAIVGLANLAPYTLVRLFLLSQVSLQDPASLPEAQHLQGIVARADFTIARASIAGTKFLLEKYYGYGGSPRRPLQPMSGLVAEALWEHPHTQALIHLERQFCDSASLHKDLNPAL